MREKLKRKKISRKQSGRRLDEIILDEEFDLINTY